MSVVLTTGLEGRGAVMGRLAGRTVFLLPLAAPSRFALASAVRTWWRLHRVVP
ncbi:hypothetical protein ACI8AC_20730 [Geodermatophilus sp. SYSU D00758]